MELMGMRRRIMEPVLCRQAGPPMGRSALPGKSQVREVAFQPRPVAGRQMS